MKPTPFSAEPLVDYREMARLSGLTEATIHRMRINGKLPALRLGHRTYRFRPSEVFQALQKMHNGKAA